MSQNGDNCILRLAFLVIRKLVVRWVAIYSVDMKISETNRVDKQSTEPANGKKGIIVLFCLFLFACGASNPPKISAGHLIAKKISTDDIPQAAVKTPFLPPPTSVPKQQTYTVVVNDVLVKDLLFALTRDAKLNVDIHPKIKGKATLNAINQTLPQILHRIAEQVDLRFKIDGPNLVISPDTPYMRTYDIDYLNLVRNSISEVSVATEISTAGGSVVGSGGRSGGSPGGKSGNKSETTVINNSVNDFWKTLTKNVSLLLDGADSENANRVVVNPMSSLLSVRATEREHTRVQQFLDKVLTNARRQVLVEATIVEVELSDRYQSGVDWARLSKNSGAGNNGPSIQSLLTGGNLGAPPFFSLGYAGAERGISATVKLLETFGNTKVLSSPKIMAINNQVALLKVVDEVVYFTVERQLVEATTTSPARETFTSEIHTVPVGLIMSVIPQITSNNTVSMNIRPTISRITGYKVDPAPRLAGVNFDNLIPEIQVREMESVLQVNSGQTVILGGLMQNSVNKDRSGVPFFADLPFIGSLFNYRNDEATKTELVIFLRPTVIQNGSLHGDFKDFRKYLPELDNMTQAESISLSDVIIKETN